MCAKDIALVKFSARIGSYVAFGMTMIAGLPLDSVRAGTTQLAKTYAKDMAWIKLNARVEIYAAFGMKIIAALPLNREFAGITM